MDILKTIILVCIILALTAFIPPKNSEPPTPRKGR